MPDSRKSLDRTPGELETVLNLQNKGSATVALSQPELRAALDLDLPADVTGIISQVGPLTPEVEEPKSI